MRPLSASFLLLAVVFGGCAQVPTDPVSSGLDGQWEGSLIVDGEDVPLVLRVLLDRKRAEVWLYEGGTWFEVKPGAFRVARHMSNAVIHATDADQDDDGTWVETWVLAGTLRSENELRVEWVRVVNNVNLPRDHHNATFTTSASGILVRAPRTGG